MTKRIIALLLCVSFLIVPTVAAADAQTPCALTEHTHTDACRSADPVCGITEEDHVHTDSCFLTCTQPEHTHDASCTPAGDAQEPDAMAIVPKPGATLWLPAETVLYEAPDSENTCALAALHTATLKADSSNGWYEIEFPDGTEESILSFTFVRAEDVLTEDPGDAPATPPTEPTAPEEVTPDDGAAQTVPACSCGSTEALLEAHSDMCQRKAYVKDLADASTAAQLAAAWTTLPEDAQTFLKTYLSWRNPTLLEELEELLAHPPVPGEETVTVDGKTFTLPGGKLTVTPLAAEKLAALESNTAWRAKPQKGCAPSQYYYFDLNGSASGRITLTGLVGDNVYKNVTVVHLLDSVEAIRANDGITDCHYFTADSKIFPEETAAAAAYNGSKDRVYYTYQPTYLSADGTVTFTASSYSTYVFVVNFEYQGLKYSISGSSSVMLSTLMSNLKMSQSVSDVTKVTFSDSSLVRVTKQGQDWRIESLESFHSTEWLTLTFQDGTVKEIKVTDPAIYYYLKGTDWNQGITRWPKPASGSFSETNQAYNWTNTTVIGTEAFDGSGGDIHVYFRPPMSYGSPSYNLIFRMTGGAAWPDGGWTGSSPQHHTDNDGIWDWSWLWYDSINHTIINFEYNSPRYSNPRYEIFEIPLTYNGVEHKLCIHIVPEYTPTLLRDVIKQAGQQYEVKTLPATLYDYYAPNFNPGKQFQFVGTASGAPSPVDVNGGGINSGGGSADMGILSNSTVNGLPVFALGDVGQDYLFSYNDSSGKSVTQDVKFEFVYENDTKYYTYYSRLNHAQYNSGSKTIELYKESLAPVDPHIAGGTPGYGGFYPYVDIYKAYTSSGAPNYSMAQWAANLTTPYDDLGYAQLAKDMVYTEGTNPPSTINMHYGVQIDSLFYLPKDRKLDGSDLKFTFNGDDDLWVFIDGQLVLDIGGGHTPVGGSFNVTTGAWEVSSGQYLTSANSEGTVAPQSGVNTFLANLAPDQMHRLQVFYLERCSGVSNCYMRFNLPIIPNSGVQVSKNVVADDGEPLTVMPDEDYKFKLWISEGGSDFKLAPGREYTVGSNRYKVNNDGTFYLKNGETAIFDDITRFTGTSTYPTKVYVEEILDNQPYVFTRTDITVNEDTTTVDFPSGSIKASETEIQLNSAQRYAFKNYIQAEPLVVEKYVEGGANALTEPNQDFNFTLTFSPGANKRLITGNITTSGAESSVYMGNDYTLRFGLQQGEYIRLERVPVNLGYTVVESQPGNSAGFVTPTYTHTVGGTLQSNGNVGFGERFTTTVRDGGENRVKVTNAQRGTITITKNGWDARDEGQTFLFHLKGTDSHNSHVELDVIVHGNGTVTIPNVPIGRYTVTEDVAWSWRYEIDDSSSVNQSIQPSSFQPDGSILKAPLTFRNKRPNDQWLDSNSWCQNLFDGSSVKQNGKNP